MERVTFDGEGGHLGGGDLDALGIAVRIRRGITESDVITGPG
jgi:hypothetical protein